MRHIACKGTPRKGKALSRSVFVQEHFTSAVYLLRSVTGKYTIEGDKFKDSPRDKRSACLSLTTVQYDNRDTILLFTEFNRKTNLVELSQIEITARTTRIFICRTI